MKLMIINGPNLNLLGRREPELYGSQSFEEFYADLQKKFTKVKLEYFQSNVEGELVTKIQDKGFSADGDRFDGIILNAGAYTHTSIAIADAVAAIKIPVIEVHISNIFAREDFRHVSFLGAKCKGSISGLGLVSYELAVEWFLKNKAGK